MHDDGLATFFILKDKHAVLKVKVYSKLSRIQIDTPKFARAQSDLLALDVLEQV